MSSNKKLYSFLADGVTFRSEMDALRLIYAPLCGVDSSRIKSAITPHLSGDIKIDKNRYLTKPQSREDLRGDVRNFFVHIKDKGVFSLAQESKPKTTTVEIGQLFHQSTRRHPSVGLEMTALNFIPVSGEDVELMRVTIKNTGSKTIRFTPTAAVPIFGRAMANKHDHEHVTALLNRISQLPEGVLVYPTMRFNEEGHKDNPYAYFVFGASDKKEKLEGTFPTFEIFYGDEGKDTDPVAVFENHAPCKLKDSEMQGKEAVGALRFKDVTLKPKGTKEFFIVMGIVGNVKDATAIFKRFSTPEQFDQALAKNQAFWKSKTHAIEFATGNADFDAWMRWITLQPILRRIFGNSFLPDHDYGKGGKGWRDLWQDLLSLILIEPAGVRENLINNFAGVRIDGSNATIIGTKPGEFLADRNMITRVWMDHGCWPLLTLLLYINQTGDYDILFEENTYFRDPQFSRTFHKDTRWSVEYGSCLKTRDGAVYRGTILEHLLLQNLVQFFNVGEHNITRLENADWNDGLDMAFERGESVAFMAFYGGNLLSLANLLERIKIHKGIDTVRIAIEMMALFDTLSEHKCDYNQVQQKRSQLFELYYRGVQPEVSGQKLDLNIADAIADLRKKGNWIFDHIRQTQKVNVSDGKKSFTWFNGYFDNKGRQVEGKTINGVQMTLTGQVFPIMSGLSHKDETADVVAAVNRFLKDPKLGGYRLNSDFGLRHYLDLGRAFGFAYGTKENGAFFSHMIVMYAYGLYAQGFVREGFDVLNSIYTMCTDSQRAKIYPGIPEYFDSEGRGMYHFLTGSASWLVLTKLTQVFGVRGDGGDLVIEPKLVREEFSKEGRASVRFGFAGKHIEVVYENKKRLDFKDYAIKDVKLGNQSVLVEDASPKKIAIKRSVLSSWPVNAKLQVILE